jgi:hypothetical protein
MPTAALLDVLDRVVPRLEHYPDWAKALFLATLVLVLVSILVYALLYPRAGRRAGEGGE